MALFDFLHVCINVMKNLILTQHLVAYFLISSPFLWLEICCRLSERDVVRETHHQSEAALILPPFLALTESKEQFGGV